MSSGTEIEIIELPQGEYFSEIQTGEEPFVYPISSADSVSPIQAEASSKNYEVVEFIPPKKTVYTMDDVVTHNLEEIDGESQFCQEVQFDCTGMSITVRNKETGKTETGTYKVNSFDLDGELLQVIDCNLTLQFIYENNSIIPPGEHTANVSFITKSGDTVTYETPFTLV